jgi:anti-sigma factor RsiW
VAQQQSGHLTIEQLSAFLDKQLSPQEWADCNAHLLTCQQCQSMLADLRQTSTLLRALPQPELPRSFVLPATITLIPGRFSHTEVSVTPITRSRRNTWQVYLQRSTRVISTIAAVLGIILVMSGFLATLSFPHGSASAVTSASVPAAAPSNVGTTTPALSQAPNADSSHNANTNQSANQKKGPSPQPTPTRSGTTRLAPKATQSGNASKIVPPLLDLSTVAGREGAGALLLILGILGIIFTRRRQLVSRR